MPQQIYQGLKFWSLPINQEDLESIASMGLLSLMIVNVSMKNSIRL